MLKASDRKRKRQRDRSSRSMQVVSKIETGDSINRVGSRETGAACWGSIQTVDSANGGGAGAWNKETGDCTSGGQQTEGRSIEEKECS